MQTFTLHLGAPKTGTKSIQGFLIERSEAVRAEGIVFPVRADSPIFVNRAGTVGHRAFALAATGKLAYQFDMTQAEMRSALLDLIEENKRNARPDFLFSSEIIYNHVGAIDGDYVDALVGDYRLRFVLYARRLDEWLESIYRQFVTGRIRASQTIFHGKALPAIEDTVHARQLDERSITSIVNMLRRKFPRAEIVIRPYSLFRTSGLVEDFLKVVGIDQENLPSSAAAEWRNRTINEPTVFLLWHLQRMGVAAATCHELFLAAQGLERQNKSLTSLPDRKLRFLPEEISKQALHLYKRDVANFEELAVDESIGEIDYRDVKKALESDEMMLVLDWIAQAAPSHAVDQARSAILN